MRVSPAHDEITFETLRVRKIRLILKLLGIIVIFLLALDLLRDLTLQALDHDTVERLLHGSHRLLHGRHHLWVIAFSNHIFEMLRCFGSHDWLIWSRRHRLDQLCLLDVVLMVNMAKILAALLHF